jgi:hypothetical protein
MAAVVPDVQASVTPGCRLVLLLEWSYGDVLLMLGQPFLTAGLVADAAGPTTEGHVTIAGNITSVHTSSVLEGLVDMPTVYVHYRDVIGEDPTAPLAASKAEAAITVAVIHAAIVADVLAPVARMEDVEAVRPAPVARRPQSAFIGCRNPRSRNPIVTVVAIGPVTGNPHQARLRAVGLHIDRKLRRRKADTDEDACVRGDRNEHDNQRQQKPARGAQQSHEKTS